MHADRMETISKLLFTLALVFFILSTFYSWHTLSYRYGGAMHYTEGFTPVAYRATIAGMNSTISFLIPYPIDRSVYTHFSVYGNYIGGRVICMRGLWYMYLASFFTLLAYGLIISFARNNLIHFTLNIIVAFLLIASIAIFLIFYPQALSYDVHRVYPQVTNVGLVQTIRVNHTLIQSSFGFGFYYAITATALFLASAVLAYLSVPAGGRKVKKKEESEVPKEEISVESEGVAAPPAMEEGEINQAEKKPQENAPSRGQEEEKSEAAEKEGGLKGKRVKVQCPNCGNYFEVEIIELPMKIKCPYCGT